MRGEPDLRILFEDIPRRGGRCALPVATERNQPLEFHTWASGQPLKRGHGNIPVPANGVVTAPNVIIAPVVACDANRFRLRYGGGYFDRTLSGITGSPRVLGVGYSMAEVPTINPQRHDIPMDAIVTEKDVQNLQTTAKGRQADPRPACGSAAAPCRP